MELKIERAFILARKLSQKIAYAVLLLYYTYKKPTTPKWVKRTILGALAYLVNPFDVIPDLTPFLGFTDDLGLIIVALGTISLHIDDNVRQQARNTLIRWFGNIDYQSVEIIENEMKKKSNN